MAPSPVQLKSLPNLATSLQTGKAAKPGPPDLLRNYGKIDTIVAPALDNVWLGKTSAKEAMQSIKAQVEAELQGVYEWTR